MKAKIYEYSGNYLKSTFVRDYNPGSCFEWVVEIPDKLNPYITVSDDIAVSFEGGTYYLDDMLIMVHDKPCISYFKINGSRKAEKLKVYGKSEVSTAFYI